MSTTNDANDEWPELHNNTSTDVDPRGWKLITQDASPTISFAGSLFIAITCASWLHAFPGILLA